MQVLLHNDSIAHDCAIEFTLYHIHLLPVITATYPHKLLCACHVVSKLYAPDNNEAIHRAI